mgnify:CR=1 FL=1
MPPELARLEKVGAVLFPDEAKLKKFRDTATAVAEEAGKVFHGGSAVASYEAWKKSFDATSSPEAMRMPTLIGDVGRPAHVDTNDPLPSVSVCGGSGASLMSAAFTG